MLKITVNNTEELDVELKADVISVNNLVMELDCVQNDSKNIHILHNNNSYSVELASEDAEKNMEIKVNGTSYKVAVKDQFDLLLKELGMESLASKKVKEVKAPMPGLVLNFMVEVGQEVKKGDNLLVLEAMKMENILKSPTDGIISKISVQKGDKVEKNSILCEFE